MPKEMTCFCSQFSNKPINKDQLKLLPSYSFNSSAPFFCTKSQSSTWCSSWKAQDLSSVASSLGESSRDLNPRHFQVDAKDLEAFNEYWFKEPKENPFKPLKEFICLVTSFSGSARSVLCLGVLQGVTSFLHHEGRWCNMVQQHTN